MKIPKKNLKNKTFRVFSGIISGSNSPKIPAEYFRDLMSGIERVGKCSGKNFRESGRPNLGKIGVGREIFGFGNSRTHH